MAKVLADINEIYLDNEDRFIIKVSLWDQDANDGEGGYNFLKISMRRTNKSHLHIHFEDALSGKLITNEMFKKLIFIH